MQEDDRWRQLIAEKLIECETLNEEQLTTVVEDAWKARSNIYLYFEEEEDDEEDWTLLQKLECVLNSLLTVCLDDSTPAFYRRNSLTTLQQIFQNIHDHMPLTTSQREDDPDPGVDEPIQNYPTDVQRPAASHDTVGENLYVHMMDSDMNVSNGSRSESSHNRQNGKPRHPSASISLPNNTEVSRHYPLSRASVDTGVPQNIRWSTYSERSSISDQPANPTRRGQTQNQQWLQPSQFQRDNETPRLAEHWALSAVVVRRYEENGPDSSRVRKDGTSDDYPSEHDTSEHDAIVDTSSGEVYVTGELDDIPDSFAAETGPVDASESNDAICPSEQTYSAFAPEESMTIVASQDLKPTKARTVEARSMTHVTFKRIIQHDSINATSILHRLNEWDPCWKNVYIKHIGITSPVAAVTPPTELIQTAAFFALDIDSTREMNLSWGIDRSTSPWKDEESTLLLRMLPQNYDSKKRSDYHSWPKGTFLQINGQPISIHQRKQIHYNTKEWKDMSQELNIVPAIKNPHLPSKVEIFCYDDQPYLYCVSFNQYRSVDTLLKCLTSTTSPEKIKTVPSDEGKKQAISFAASLISIGIDSDDEDDKTDELGKFVVSLKCPISKSIMDIPVRGKNCMHRQVCGQYEMLDVNLHIT
jgi:hypothetical protein